MNIFAIETSCDETAASLIQVKNNRIKILSNVVFSQIDIHRAFGGVVPEVAAREHLQKIIPVIKKALIVKPEKIDLIAVTKGPGLITSLQVGLQTAKSLSYAWQKPLIGINHLEAHLYSSWLSENLIKAPAKKLFPAICLIVSGGHTELVLIKGYGNYKLLGETRDDAAGEAFDKVAKLLDLGYPGGPALEKWAKKGKNKSIELPRPMLNEKNFDFSFSGLKTSVRYFLQGKKLTPKLKADLAASFQQAVIDVLVKKTLRAAQEFNCRSIFIGGGVSANKLLRSTLANSTKKSKLKFYCPEFAYTQDNAAIIGITAYFNRHQAKLNNWQKLNALPNLRLTK